MGKLYVGTDSTNSIPFVTYNRFNGTFVLGSRDWNSNKQQTLTVNNLDQDSDVLYCFSDDSMNEARKSGVVLYKHSSSAVSFSCVNVPRSNIEVTLFQR